MAWIICPRFYEQRWLLDRPMKNGVELQLGRKFHLMAHDFFDEVPRDDLLKCRNKEEVFDLLKVFIPDNAILGEWMTNFVNWEINQWLGLCAIMPPKKALGFWIPLDTELEIVTDDAEYHFDRIDRLIWQDAIVVIEYKSGKWFNKTSLRKELVFYNNAINTLKRYQLPCPYIGYYNPQLNKEWREYVTMTQRTKNKQLVAEFKYADTFPCRRSTFCAYCSYFLDCPCWKNGGD